MPVPGRISKLAAAAALASLGIACTGQVGSGNSRGGPGEEGPGNGPGAGPGSGPGNGPGAGPGSGPGNGGGGGGGGVTPQVPGQPGVSVFRRLTRTEYNNTVRDLLGDSSAPANAFPPDQDSAKSGYFAGGSVSNADASRLFEAADALAAKAMGRIAELLPCNPMPTAAPAQDQCAGQFITQFGKRAFRRPLTPDETNKFKDFYAAQRTAGADFPNAIRMVVSGFLLSPQFLYRWEATPQSIIRDGALVRFNSYEIASRLSYLFWASMPDEAAFGLADQNKLSTPEQIEAEARRMLKDPKAKASLGEFFQQWLALTHLHEFTKDSAVYPKYSKELGDAMLAETAAFAASAVIDGDGKLSTVFTSNKGFVDAKLAELYGVTGTGAIDLNPAQRAGILTQAAFLTTHASPNESNPPRRGKVMADRVICVDIPSPPDDVPEPEKPSASKSVRDRFEEHDRNPCAAACHNVIDPLGFAFEHYNGVGAYQTMDGGKAVNASGTIKLDGQDKPFKNAIELGKHLGASKQVAECMARQFLRYTLRRREGLGDEQSLTATVGNFDKDNHSVRDMFVAFTKTRAFTHRTPSNGEMLP